MTVKNKYQSFYRSQEDTMVRNKNTEPKFCILSVDYSLPSSPARDIFTENDGNDDNSNSMSHDNKEFETQKMTLNYCFVLSADDSIPSSFELPLPISTGDGKVAGGEGG